MSSREQNLRNDTIFEGTTAKNNSICIMFKFYCFNQRGDIAILVTFLGRQRKL